MQSPPEAAGKAAEHRRTRSRRGLSKSFVVTVISKAN